MKAFHFALQPLLDARMREETQCRAALALAARAATGARTREAEARAGLAAASRTFRDCAPSWAPAVVRDAIAHFTLLAQAVHSAQLRSQRCAEHESLACNAFSAARLERRRIETLRERAMSAFARQADRRETLVLDEANEARHNSATLLASSFHN